MSAPPDPSVLLDLLPQEDRSPLAQWFYRAARHGCATPAAVAGDALGMLMARAREEWAWAEHPWNAGHREAIWERANRFDGWVRFLRDEPAAAEQFAAYVLWREALPPEARDREKTLRYQAAREAARAAEPATDRQLAYLRALGWHQGAASKAEASTLIERLKR